MSAIISGSNTGVLQEDVTRAISGTLKVDGATGLFTAVEIAGIYGDFSLSEDGEWSYVLDNPSSLVQELGVMASAQEDIEVIWTGDETLTGSVAITIFGQNDAAVISGDTQASLMMVGTRSAEGLLAIDDPDDGDKSFVPQTATQGRVGEFALAADGAWTYALFEDVLLLDAAVEDTFLLQTKDGTGARVTITVSPDLPAGTDGDDRLYGSGADDLIDGLNGNDTVTFDSYASEYHILLDRAARRTTVTDTQGREGTDTLINVERLQFSGQTFDLFNLPLASAPAYNQSRDFLFDAAYYLLSHPELASSVTLQTAFDHYLNTGAALGYQPNSWFDPTYYENRWADLKSANLDDATLFLHYNLYGVWEGRSAGPTFDQYNGNRYLADNPDVAAYVDAFVNDFLGSRTNGAIAHYIIYGEAEGRHAFNLTGNPIDPAILIGVTA